MTAASDETMADVSRRNKPWVSRCAACLQGPWVRRLALIAVVAFAVGGLVALGLRLKPTPRPDIWDDDVPDIAMFIFEPEFSALSVDERMNFLVDFADRFRQFDQTDAAVLASFVADINRKMRDQAEENMRRLATDLMSERAAAYQNVPPSERAAFLEQFIIDMEKFGERLLDEPRDETDDDRIARLKRQARRDRERAQERSDRPRANRVGAFFSFYEQASAESGMGPVEKGQTARLILDLTRHLRGDDPDQ